MSKYNYDAEGYGHGIIDWIKKCIFRYEMQNSGGYVLEDISMKIYRGDFMCIVGPSGCGKSTLVKLIAPYIKQSSGEVLWKDTP